jgi:exosortase
MSQPLTAIGLIWLQLFWTLVPTWRFGEYYGYGWFVPVLAAALAWNRCRTMADTGADPPVPPTRISVSLAVGVMLALALIAPLRLVSIADPAWRPPLLLHALLVMALTHLLLWKRFTRRISLRILPVSLFALTAVPYPYQFEQALIHKLTGAVAGLAHEIFILTGRPVELLGERLSIGADVVEVSEGCSGIRSFQSLIMTALFFGELLLLSVPRRLLLIGVAAACSLGVNTLRAFTLAEVHFSRGKQVADKLHDVIGNSAFVISAAILFFAARCMLPSAPASRRVVRTTTVVNP